MAPAWSAPPASAAAPSHGTSCAATCPLSTGIWIASTVLVLTVYPHHLLMDFEMPHWVLIAGQILSWCSGMPAALVTAFGMLTIVYRSGIHRDTACGLLFVGIFG
jgi:cytochrome c oxidase subunit 1